MRILVLHSDVPPDAPPEDIDTLTSAEAVAQALKKHGHAVSKAPFTTDKAKLKSLLAREKADVIFNLVEGIDGLGRLAPLAPKMLEELGVTFTGVDYRSMHVTTDKPLTKKMLREAGIGTADWHLPSDWDGLGDKTYIVKSTLEDASVGLDDGCVVTGPDAVKARYEQSHAKHGGDWFAEEFIDGREYNISMMQGADGKPFVFPLAEMRFDDWPADKPRIVGYPAKWDESLDINDQMVRSFDTEKAEPVLARKIKDACVRTWKLFDFCGYVRIDFRVTPGGEPLVLEINTNPCIAPDAGFAAAGEQIGLSYDKLIVRVVEAAVERARPKAPLRVRTKPAVKARRRAVG
jgi:D-alanine-D-alanine ligase